MLVLFKQMILALFILMMAGQAQAEQMRIWSKTTQDQAKLENFLLNMETNGFVKNGELTVDGLCEAAFAGVPNRTIADKAEFCQMFKWQNSVTEKSLTVDEFRNREWIVPDNSTIVAFNAEGKKASSSVASLNTLPPVAEKPAQAVVQNTDIGTLEKRLAFLTKQAQGNNQALVVVQQLKQSIASLKLRLETLENRGLSAQDKEEIAAMIAEKTSALSFKVENLIDNTGTLNDRMSLAEDNIAKHDTQIQANLPLGYNLVNGLMGETAAENYLAATNLIQICFLVLVGAVTLLVYPILIGKTRNNVKNLERKVSQVSTQVASVIEFTFDQDVVKKENLLKMKVGSSFDLLLLPNDLSEESVKLIITRSGDNQVTIKGALRRKGSSAPLVCGLATVAQSINRAIYDVRIEKSSTLQAVA